MGRAAGGRCTRFFIGFVLRSMMAVLLSAGIVLLGSLTIGQLACRLTGEREWTWLSAPVGFSVLMVVGVPSVQAPERMAVAAVLVAILAISGVVLMVREIDSRPPLSLVPTVLPTTLLAMVPFVVNSRFGILGVSFNNDMAAHLLLTDAMRSAAVESVTPLLTYYPLGPHAIAALVGTGLGVSTDAAFTGLTIAVPILTACVALEFLHDLRISARALVGALTALPFLAAGYYAQGAFKETIMVLLVLGSAAAITSAGRSKDVRRYGPLGLILAGVMSSYSYLGLAWPMTALGLCVLGWLAQHRRLTLILRTAVSLVPAVAIGVAVLVVALIPQFPRILAFYDWNGKAGIRETDIGNLVGPLHPAEALGTWFNPDFRLPPPDVTMTRVWSILVVVALVYSVAWWLRRRDVVLPVAFVACVAVWGVSDLRHQSPYTSAKALAICSPFIFLLIGRALLHSRPRPHRLRLILRLVPGVCLSGVALWCSMSTLRFAEVGPKAHADDLAAVRPLLRGKPTLYLGFDDFIEWEFRGVPVVRPFGAGALSPGSGDGTAFFRPEKKWKYGESIDADSVKPDALDRFEYVVTSRAGSASSFPENFEHVADRGVFEVFHRTGPTEPRQVLDERENGAALFDCSTPEGFELSRRGGIAATRGPLVPVSLGPMKPGGSQTVQLPLPPGVWDLSLRYTSPHPIRIKAPGLNLQLPASLDRAGSVWPAGTITVTQARPTPVTLSTARHPLGLRKLTVLPTTLVASERQPTEILPLRSACGRFVDWYRAR